MYKTFPLRLGRRLYRALTCFVAVVVAAAHQILVNVSTEAETVDLKINYGDGSDPVTTAITKSGASVSFIMYEATHTYNTSGVYRVRKILLCGGVGRTGVALALFLSSECLCSVNTSYVYRDD